MIDSAEKLDDLRVPPGNRLEAIKGDRQGQYSIRINDQYRICFRPTEADFEQVRGDFESNSVVKMIHEHIYKKSNLADEVIRQLK